jgi:4-carboxymuconolactone decarboxylase
LEQLTARERLLVEVVRALLRTRALPDDLYARALAKLGRQQLIETVALAGHYSLIGLTVNAFDVAPPDNSSTF